MPALRVSHLGQEVYLAGKNCPPFQGNLQSVNHDRDRPEGEAGTTEEAPDWELGELGDSVINDCVTLALRMPSRSNTL